MSIQSAAADLASRIPAMAQDSPLNCQGVIARLMEQAVEEEVLRKTDEMAQQFYVLGWCPKCKSEIQHDITEPFASCNCPDGFGEATEIPIIPGLRHQLAVLQREYDELKAGLRTAMGIKSTRQESIPVIGPPESPVTLPDPKPCDPHTPH